MTGDATHRPGAPSGAMSQVQPRAVAARFADAALWGVTAVTVCAVTQGHPLPERAAASAVCGWAAWRACRFVALVWEWRTHHRVFTRARVLVTLDQPDTAIYDHGSVAVLHPDAAADLAARITPDHPLWPVAMEATTTGEPVAYETVHGHAIIA